MILLSAARREDWFFLRIKIILIIISRGLSVNQIKDRPQKKAQERKEVMMMVLLWWCRVQKTNLHQSLTQKV